MKIWDRQRGETDKAFAAWLLYRDLPAPRAVDLSATAAGAAISARRPTWIGWARRFAWRERAAGWDAEVDRSVLDRTVNTRVERMEAWAGVLDEARALVVQRLATMSADELTPADLPRYIQACARLEQTLAASSATEAQRDAVAHFAETMAAAEARHRKPGDGSVH